MTRNYKTEIVISAGSSDSPTFLLRGRRPLIVYFHTNSDEKGVKFYCYFKLKSQLKNFVLFFTTIMQICRICLVTDTKLYDMKEYSLELFYEQITGLNMSEEDKLPQKICWECAHRLVSCSKFKSKAARSQELMMELLHDNHYLSSKSIKSIDRYVNNLASNLTYKAFNVNHNDLHLHDTSPLQTDELKSENDNQELEVDLEVKNEDETRDFEFNVEENSEHSNSSNEVLAKKVKKQKGKKEKQEIVNQPKIDRRRKPANEVLNEEIFSITDLSFDEQKLEIEKRQETSNYRRSEFRCAQCFKGFLDEEAYNSHMIRHTDLSGAYECEICKVHFKKQHALRNHVASHMQKFSCKRCPYVTTRRHAAKLHEDYHNGTRYQCPHCQEDFSKFSTYMSHVRIKHPSDFVCVQCGYTFVSGKGLALHKILKHRFHELPVPDDGPYCERCDVRFVSEEALSRHVRLSARHHDNTDAKDSSTRKRARRDTEEKREKKDSPQKNKNNYKPEGPIPCEQCEMQLPDSISYYRHFRRMHPDKNRTNYPSMKTKCMCEVCGKMFQSLALLQDHSFTHTDSKQFKCSQCDKTFQRKYRLIAHRRLHAAQRVSHACAVCGKLFTTTSNMQRHMVSHTGLKPFKCEMCGKCFKHASEKRVHITYVHLKKPWPKRTRGKRRSDGRQPQLPQSMPTGSDMDIVQPLWPSCSDPKVVNIPMDKPMYYNLKI